MRALTAVLCAAALALVAAAAIPVSFTLVSIEPSFDPLPSAEPLSISSEPELEPEPSAPAIDIILPSPEPSKRDVKPKTYAVILELLHARTAVAGELDAAVRAVSAKASRTAPSDWTLIDAQPIVVSPSPTPPSIADADIALVVSRQDVNIALNDEPGPRPLRRWRAFYHARLPDDAVPTYTTFVRDGDMSSALRNRAGVGFVRARFLAPPRKVRAAPMVQAPPRTITPAAAAPVAPTPGIKRQAPPSATSSSTSSTDPQPTPVAAVPGKPAPSASSTARRPLPWQIGVGVGLVALAAAVAVLALFALRGRRRSAHNPESLGGLSRSPSENLSAPEYRVTSVGAPPRGHDALRHQAGIMHWQHDAAAAAGDEAAGELPPLAPSAGVARNTSLTSEATATTAITSTTALGTSQTSSLYVPQSSSSSVLARTISASTEEEIYTDYTNEEDEARPLDSLGSTAFALGDDSPPPSSHGANAAPVELSFVNFGTSFGGPT